MLCGTDGANDCMIDGDDDACSLGTELAKIVGGLLGAVLEGTALG